MTTHFARTTAAVWMLLGAVCLWVGPAASVAGDAEPETVAEKQTEAEFTPLGTAQLDSARQAVRRAAASLGKRLDQDGENGVNWGKYLRLGVLDEQLADGDKPDFEKLGNVYDRLDRDFHGLQLVWFADLRLALGRYLNLAQSIDNPEIETAYKRLVEKTLPEQLERYKKDPTPALAYEIGSELGWLTDFCQGEELVQRTREALARPNVFLEISSDFVAAGMAGPIDETTPIEDVILGTTICGTGKTKGQLTVELIPCKTQAVFETTMSGTTESDNTGYNGPAVIYTTGVTEFTASKRMTATADGIDSQPATSEATTSTTINQIATRRGSRLIQRMAWRRACSQKSQAEAIAAQHAECRVNRRMDQQGDEAATDTNRRYEERFRGPLQERKIFAEKLTCSTTKSKVLVQALRAAYDQLAAPSDPPKLAEPADIAMRVHESLINNSATTMLAGRSVSEEEFLDTVKDIFGEVPENLRPEEGSPPWTIQFAESEPFTVTFGDGGYTVAMHADGFVRDGTEYTGMNISAAYKIEKTDEGFVTVRQGDLSVYPPGFVKGERKLSGREQTLRGMLTPRFEKIFSEKIVPQGHLEPKGRWKKIGRVPMTAWTTQDGWMTIAWKMTPDEAE